jgi:hypothetical protein
MMTVRRSWENRFRMASASRPMLWFNPWLKISLNFEFCGAGASFGVEIDLLSEQEDVYQPA